MGYNQHQSFYLRDRWLSKAIRSIAEDPSFFFEKDAFEKIGLGKNMVQSLRHWIKAMGVVNEFTKEKIHVYTHLGQWIKDNDITLKYFETAAMLHYELVKQKEPSSSWYWYFNEFTETIATKEEIFHELTQWVGSTETRVVSESSIKRDVDCLIRMYTSGDSNEDPEEVTLSPLSILGLIHEKNGMVYKTEPNIPKGKHEFILYILFDFCEVNDQYEISLNDLIYREGLLGKVFNLSRSTIVTILTELENHPKYPIKFTRTNNLDMLQIPIVKSKNFLEEITV